MEAKLITETAAQLIQEAKAFLESKTLSMSITSETEYLGAGELITLLKKKKKALDDTRKSEKEEYLNNGRKVDAEFNPTIELCEEKIKIIENAGREYRRVQEELAAKSQKELEDKAEAERAKLEAQAGTNAEKAARLRDEAAKLTSQAGQCNDLIEKNRLLNEAQKYENRACKYDEKVEQKKELAQTVVAPVVQAAIPAATRGGFNTRVQYVAKITDIGKVMDHLKPSVPPAILAVITQWANQQARASAGAASTIPGVEFLKQ